MAPTSKLLAASTPIATGIRAAYFARAGMTGHARTLEDRRGFWRRFSFLPLPFMLEQLGELWVLDSLTIKTYPGCHYFQTALTALERILTRRGGALAAADVARVTVDTTKLGCEVTRFAGDYVGAQGELSPVRVNFDLAASCALFLFAGRLTPDEMEADFMVKNLEGIRRWLRLVRVRHDPALTAKVIGSARRLSAGKKALASLGIGDLRALARRYADEYGSRLFSFTDAVSFLKRAPMAIARRRRVALAGEGIPLFFPSRVTVELQNGQREVEEVELPVASMASPDVLPSLRAKVLASLSRTVGPDRAEAALGAGLAPEELAIEALVRLFSGS
jgi:hypothetical protein